MSLKTTSTSAAETDDGYFQFEYAVRDRVAAVTGPVFQTAADPEELWAAYLDGLPADRRQHYTCRACQAFVRRYGGLVVVGPGGSASSVVWGADVWPAFFAGSVGRMRSLVEGAAVTGVFLSPDATWGTPMKGGWSHLSGPRPRVFTDKLKTADQAMAENTEDFGILCRSLADYPEPVAAQAVRVLSQGSVYRSEKAQGVAEWFHSLHKRLEGVQGAKRSNLVWLAVAEAPVGYCHVRSTVISTLLDDIASGLSFESISRRWAEKLHPLQYQRPTAAPSAGAVEAAEKLVEKLGVADSLKRRFATLEDVLKTEWVPREPEKKSTGVFGHLLAKVAPARSLALPNTAITWEKFRRTVLPTAAQVEVLVPAVGPFYGLVTAAVAEAPPVLQWDGLSGHLRNPVSWYFYSGGSQADQWHLTAGTWARATAVFRSPHEWQEADRFAHQGRNAHFALAGAWDARGADCGLCLFPEILKAEFHGIRSVIEAHSKAGGIRGAVAGTANGLAFQGGSSQAVRVRVTDGAGTAEYTIDRWD